MNEDRIGFMLMIDHFYLPTNLILQSIQINMLTGTDSVHKDIYKNGNKFIWKALHPVDIWASLIKSNFINSQLIKYMYAVLSFLRFPHLSRGFWV